MRNPTFPPACTMMPPSWISWQNTPSKAWSLLWILTVRRAGIVTGESRSAQRSYPALPRYIIGETTFEETGE